MLRVAVRWLAPASVMSSVLWRPLCSSSVSPPHYDLVVIGGGSGGLACSKQAAELNKKVAVLDFVSPSQQGTTWGLGGTCVNVGCIPKKLMHNVSQMREVLDGAKQCGWDVDACKATFSWEVMCDRVQNYVKSLNWGHRVQLREKKVTYLNVMGSFIDRNTIKTVDKKGTEGKITADYIVIACGGRPRYPDIPGAREYGITSDDLFWMKKPPGKTLVIGGSYVALECAGFLTGMKYDTSVMVRSICLRGFDQQMAALVSDNMAASGTNFLWHCVPTSLERSEDGRIKVTWDDQDGGGKASDTFDTVLFAIGRDLETSRLSVDNAGVEVISGSGKVRGDYLGEAEKSSVPNIYAIGDVLEGGVELTPVAIRAGKLLADRLFGKSKEMMDYEKVATTVFTPLEYACVGLSEEDATERYGAHNIEIYHAFYKPLEYVLTEKSAEQCYIKIICDVGDSDRILGFHLTGPNAGEIMQGFSTAINLGLTRTQLVSTVGIHPTSAEEVVKLHISKSSGLDATVTGC